MCRAFLSEFAVEQLRKIRNELWRRSRNPQNKWRQIDAQHVTLVEGIIGEKQ